MTWVKILCETFSSAGTRPLFLNVSAEHFVKEIGEEGRPAAVPFDKLKESPMAGWYVEPKFPCRGFAGAMQFYETRTKSVRIQKIVAHVIKIAEEIR